MKLIKNIFTRLSTFFYLIYFKYFEDIRFYGLKNKIKFFRVHNIKNCKIYLDDLNVKKLLIDNQGENFYSLKGFIRNCKFQISGMNNEIYLDKDIKLINTKIVIRGNNCKVMIGRFTTIAGANMVCMGKNNSIKIGEECMLSENIEIWSTDSHPIFNVEDQELLNPSRSVTIKNHVWIGKNVSILKGVVIGEDSIVGMSSVVTTSISPNCIAVGNPAKVKKSGTTWRREFITKYEVDKK